eukprot:30953-Chlamydomonas_euryale.AAC.9
MMCNNRIFQASQQQKGALVEWQSVFIYQVRVEWPFEAVLQPAGALDALRSLPHQASVCSQYWHGPVTAELLAGVDGNAPAPKHLRLHANRLSNRDSPTELHYLVNCCPARRALIGWPHEQQVCASRAQAAMPTFQEDARGLAVVADDACIVQRINAHGGGTRRRRCST